MAKAFAALGSKVVLSAGNISELTCVKDECLSKGADPEILLILPLDLVDCDVMPKAFKIIIDKFARIDELINNAGQGAREFSVDIDLSICRRIMDVNLFGAVALSNFFLPTMIKQ